jgi:hypothetical protein
LEQVIEMMNEKQPANMWSGRFRELLDCTFATIAFCPLRCCQDAMQSQIKSSRLHRPIQASSIRLRPFVATAH